jgi:hypothetical protein
MVNIWLDHFITYTSASNIDDYIKEYATQGFLPDDTTVRHDPGLRNRFIFLGPEYIEFCWVEDEELFEKADEVDKQLRASHRPFGIGMIADDVNAIHADWTALGFSMPEVESKAARDAASDAPPAWSFQVVPDELLPGASCFVLTYHKRPKQKENEIKIHPNTIYAIAGVTFVTEEPEAHATRWGTLLAPGERVNRSQLGFDVLFGPHRALWMTAENYKSTYGLEWNPAPHCYGEIAVLHLLASNLVAAKNILEQSGRQVFTIEIDDHEVLLIAPDGRDGFIFSLRQQAVEIWAQERMARTGEKIIFLQG